MSDIVQADDVNFQSEVLESETPVLVEFGATWCGPCQRQRPILDQFKQNHPDVKVVLVDVDDSTKTAATYGVRSVPTLILFNKGQKVKSIIGLSTLNSLNSLLTV